MEISFFEIARKDESALQSEIKRGLDLKLKNSKNFSAYSIDTTQIIPEINKALIEVASTQVSKHPHLKRKTIKLNKGNIALLSSSITKHLNIALKNTDENSLLAFDIKELSTLSMAVIEGIARKEKLKNKVRDKDKELENIITFMETRWDGFESLDIKGFFNQIWSKSLELSKFNIGRYNLGRVASQWKEEREDWDSWKNAGSKLTQKEIDLYINNDFICSLYRSLETASDKYNELLLKSWDYEGFSKKIMKEVLIDFPQAKKLKPKGWNALAKNYEENDGQKEYIEKQQKINEREFKGLKERRTSHLFHERVSLPFVMYENNNQRRSPLEVLVNAMLGYAYEINSQNNTAVLRTELNQLKDELNNPEYYQEIILNMNIKEKFKNTITNTITKGVFLILEETMNIVTEEEFNNWVNANSIPLTPEQIKKNEQDVEDFLASLSKNLTKEEKAQELIDENREKEELAKKLWDFLNSTVDTNSNTNSQNNVKKNVSNKRLKM